MTHASVNERQHDPGSSSWVDERTDTSPIQSLSGAAEAGSLVDPYPLYARLRTEKPIHCTSRGLWVLTRHSDVAAVLRDVRFGREGFERHFATDSSSADGGG